PILSDELQLIGESLGFTRNGEVLIVNPQNWKVLYRGAYAKGSSNYVTDALDAALSGTPVKIAETEARGCNIVMPERERRSAHAQISYEKSIAPMLTENCGAFIREGG